MADQEGVQALEEPADRPEPAYRKKVRTLDPDLTITCRSGQGEARKEKSFQCHSAFFALNSAYFDALLSSEMEEAASKHVTLEDVDPDTFDHAMTLLEQLHHSSTKLEDLLKVASIYSRFQFEKGIKYVQSRVGAFLDDIHPGPIENPSILDTVIDCALVAEEASMQDQLTDVEEILELELEKDLIENRKFFTLSQLRRLQPFLVARPQWVGDILDHWSSRLHPPDMSSDDFPEFLHSLLVESSNWWTIRNSGLKIQIDFRISPHREQARGIIECKGHELEIAEVVNPLWISSKNINWDANSRLTYYVRLCRFGHRGFEFRQCHHEDLHDMDWCMSVWSTTPPKPMTLTGRGTF